MSSVTIVTREPEWDADQRGRALRLTEWFDNLCPCGCALPIQQAHEKLPFLVDHYTCYAGRAMDQLKRKHTQEAEEQKAPEGWDDGRRYYVTVAEPDEKRKPRMVSAKQEVS